MGPVTTSEAQPRGTAWRIIHHPAMLLLIGTAFTIVAIAVSIGAYELITRLPGDWWSVLASCVVAAIFVAMYALFCRRIEQRPVVEFSLSGWALELSVGVVAGVIVFSTVVGVIALLGGYQVIAMRGPAVLVPALALAIMSGFTEEIFFRGLFFRLSEKWLGSWAALALSAALFGGLHLHNPNATWFAGLAIAFEAGILLAAVYMITRRLWAAIGLHAAWNFVEGGVYSIPISGGKFDGVLVPRIAPSEILTGGAFGAEASLPAMIVATAFGLALLAVAWRRGSFIPPLWVRNRQFAARQE
jgi:membrane protease YdiL (CAAX protease family)